MFVCGYPVSLTPFVEEAVFSPTLVFGTFVKNQVAVDVWVYLWNFCSGSSCLFCASTMLYLFIYLFMAVLGLNSGPHAY
jgi:hypothetical protein